MSEHVDVYGMLKALTATLPVGSRMTVETLRDNATGYVWGHEDASGQRVREAYGRVVQGDWDFPIMYATYACLYELGQLTHRQPIQDAYRAFRASRDLNDYVS